MFYEEYLQDKRTFNVWSVTFLKLRYHLLVMKNQELADKIKIKTRKNAFSNIEQLMVVERGGQIQSICKYVQKHKNNQNATTQTLQQIILSIQKHLTLSLYIFQLMYYFIYFQANAYIFNLLISVQNFQYKFLSFNPYQMKANNIVEKYQLIDDESAFRIEQLQGLANAKIKNFGKQYHLISVIGSQSSGKSTLLNAIFSTQFETLNRRKRVGQTTKGIWYSVDQPSKIMILDVQGSDSNQRQQRTKIQRRNSLFALAVSHTLLINIWIQQIGLYKGSQLSILQIILQLNLKLFGSQKPKQIIFVVRDFIAQNQNQNALRQKLFSKVQEAWNNIPKPPGKQNIKLKDIFHLQAFFLPSKIEQKQQFASSVQNLRKYLIDNSKRMQLTKDNVPFQDFPLYIQNLWHTIQQDKDINLPQQKILLSNMRCHQIQKKIYQDFEQQFRDQLQKSQRKMNQQFAKNIGQIVGKMLDSYNQQTCSYIKQEADKVRQQFIQMLQRKIELSFSYQIRLISEQCLKQFVQQVNRNFMKQKNIESIKQLKPKTIQNFQNLIKKVSYKQQWIQEQRKVFIKSVQDSFEHQKQKIISDSLKDFDRSIKKQIQGLISTAFYDKTIFCTKFWQHINQTYRQIEHKAKNSIIGLYTKLQIRQKGNQLMSKRISQHVEKAKYNAHQQLKTIIKMKCHDLLFYIMRHFNTQFNMDDKQIPRQWVDMKPQQITALYQSNKKRYIDLLENFKNFNLNQGQQQASNLSPGKAKLVMRSSFQEPAVYSDELISLKDINNYIKKLDQQMKSVYEEALQKNKQVYSGSIPLWGWVVFLLVAIDDVFLWLHSPYLAIPLTIILILFIVLFITGGKSAAGNVVNTIKSGARGLVANITTQAAASMMKKDN